LQPDQSEKPHTLRSQKEAERPKTTLLHVVGLSSSQHCKGRCTVEADYLGAVPSGPSSVPPPRPGNVSLVSTADVESTQQLAGRSRHSRIIRSWHEPDHPPSGLTQGELWA